MRLEGSCQCGKVRFRLKSAHPYPFNVCYCGICTKTAGAGGFAINLSGDSGTLEVEGREHITIYKAKVQDAESGETRTSSGERNFCSICGSMLWLWAPDWPELIHPFASAVDTPLPVPPERTHLMLGSKANWVGVRADPEDRFFERYPSESIAGWHQRLGLERPD